MEGVFICFLTNEGKEFYLRSTTIYIRAMDTDLCFTWSFIQKKNCQLLLSALLCIRAGRRLTFNKAVSAGIQHTAGWGLYFTLYKGKDQHVNPRPFQIWVLFLHTLFGFSWTSHLGEGISKRKDSHLYSFVWIRSRYWTAHCFKIALRIGEAASKICCKTIKPFIFDHSSDGAHGEENISKYPFLKKISQSSVDSRIAWNPGLQYSDLSFVALPFL